MTKYLATIILFILPSVTTHSVEDFVTEHFENETIVIISSNFQNWNVDLEILLKSDNMKIIINPQAPEDTDVTFKNYIIVEDDFNGVSYSVNELVYNINTSGSYLVILQQNSTDEELKSIFQMLWSLYIYDVVIFTNWTKYVTWYPYSTDNLCGDVVNLVTNQGNYFSNEIPKNFKSCSINVTWSNIPWPIKSPFDKTDPGFAIIALDTIGEKLGLEVKYLRDQLDYYPIAISNGSFEVLCRYMATAKIDVGFTMGGFDTKYGKEIETTKMLAQHPQHFIFPPRRKIRNSRKIFTIFSIETWSILFVTIVTMSVLWRMTTNSSYSNCLFYTIQLTIQCVVNKVPQNDLTRFLFFIFLFCITYMNWFYVSQMSSVLTRPSYEPHLKTISDIINSDKTVKIYSLFKHYLQRYIGNETCEKLWRKVDKDSDRMPPGDIWMEQFVSFANFGTVLNEQDYKNKFREYRKLNIASYDNVFTSCVIWSVRRGFPLMKKFNYWIARFLESGLVTKWMEDSAVNMRRYNFSQLEDNLVPLNFDHVFSVFVLLIGGLSLSLLCFIAEVIWGRKSQRHLPDLTRNRNKSS